MKDWKLHHIAVVVQDIDKAIRYYESLGIATVGREVIFPEPKPKIRAKPVEVRSISIAFMQPIEGESSRYKEFLDSKGEGVQHIAFSVDNLDEETAELVDKGVSIIGKRKAPTAFGGISTHFDTSQVGGFYIQLIQEAE